MRCNQLSFLFKWMEVFPSSTTTVDTARFGPRKDMHSSDQRSRRSLVYDCLLPSMAACRFCQIFSSNTVPATRTGKSSSRIHDLEIRQNRPQTTDQVTLRCRQKRKSELIEHPYWDDTCCCCYFHERGQKYARHTPRIAIAPPVRSPTSGRTPSSTHPKK